MIVSRTEQQIIRQTHPLWSVIDEMCFNAKNLYNYANYIIRQEYINNKRYIPYKEMNFNLKTHQQYKDCMSQPANCILRLLDKNWKSFFKGLKEYEKNPKKFLGRPQIPKYLKKDGRFNWMIPNNCCYFENEELKFRIRKLQSIKWKCRCVGRLIQVRFVPKGCVYVMEIVSQIEVPDATSENQRIVGIDLGVNNLATASNNIGEQPFIINGRGLKNINQFYNKRRSELQSKLPKGQFWSKQLEQITFKRFNRVKNYMHHASHYIVKWCLQRRALTNAIQDILAVKAADVQPVNQWISVNDRLPEATYDCLVWYSCDTAFGKSKSWGIAHCSRCDWYTKHLDGDNIVVLYWMPLPEPPKDGDAE